MITREQFEDYENVRSSGITNMFDLRMVRELTGLDIDEIREIQKNYGELQERYLKEK